MLDRLLYIISCVLLLTLMLGLGSWAADEDEPDALSEGDQYCADLMIENGAALVSNYENFLNEYFKVDVPSSTQVESAMDYYRYIEDSLFTVYADSAKIPQDLALVEASQTLTKCAYVRDQFLEYAQELLKIHTMLSVNSKRTFKLLDGLKALNTHMELYSDEFNQTFPGIFNQMNNALPCYARQCISK